MRIERIFLGLLSIPSPPGGEEAASRFCARFLAERGFRVEVDRLGNVAAKRGEGPFTALVAHLDDWGSPSRRRFRLLRGGAVVPTNGMPLGGDDKCGVALALRAACDPGRPLAVLLTVQEEVGGRGCQAFARQRPDWFEDVATCLVLDRRGAGDVVVEIGGRVLDPVGAFRGRVLAAGRAVGVAVREVSGLFSDALILHLETGLPVANISVGYHEPHSPQEWVSLPQLRRAWRWVDRILVDGTADQR